MAPNVALGLVNIVSALIIIGVSVPLAKRRIRMNYLYGIRLPKSFESEENWYRINEYGGRQLIIWSVPVLLAGLVCLFVPIDDADKDVMALVLGVLPISVSLTIAVIRILFYARRV